MGYFKLENRNWMASFCLLSALLAPQMGRAGLFLSESKQVLPAENAKEALEAAFEHQNLSTLLKEFQPSSPWWNWERVQSSTPAHGPTIPYGFILNKNIEAYRKFEAQEKEKSKGFWAGLKSTVLGVVSHALVGDTLHVAGQVSSGAVSCSAPYESVGKQLVVDLDGSDTAIGWIAEKLYLKVCFRELPPAKKAPGEFEISMVMEMDPGNLYRNASADFVKTSQDPHLKEFVETQSDAWVTALLRVVGRRQALLMLPTNL